MPHGTAIGGDPAIVGDEVVQRVFRGDPALDRMAAQLHPGLVGHTRGFGDGAAFLDQDLGRHDVDARHLLGHGMLDLDAGVHLDEVELARLHVLQELDGARAFVVHRPRDRHAHGADLLALFLAQVRGRGAFHDLLVAPLHRTVPFPQVPDGAVLVAQHLHLDMAGLQDHLLQVALAIAERGLGLAAALAHLGLQLLGPEDGAHAAPAATPGRLQHQRIADLRGLGAHKVHVVAQDLGRRDHRHARRNRHPPGRRLVAKRAHRLGPRPDEGDAFPLAGLDQFGVLRQQPVARVDRIRPGQLGHPDDLGDRQVRRDRPQPFAHLVGLVRLEAVQAQLVLLGIDGDRLLAQLVGRAHDADGDLAAVGDQDLLELGQGASLRCAGRIVQTQHQRMTVP